MKQFVLGISRRYYTLLWAAYGLFSLLFGYTRGLAYLCNDVEPDRICYINQLTAGAYADENYCISFGVVLSVLAVAWGIIYYRLALNRTTSLLAACCFWRKRCLWPASIWDQ